MTPSQAAPPPQPTAKAASSSTPIHSLPPALQIFLSGSVLLFLAAWGTEWLCYHVLHLPFIPYGSPTLTADQNFVDMVLFFQRFQHLHTLTFFSQDPAVGAQYLYPAPAALIYRPYYILFGPDYTALLWFIVCVLLLASILFFVVLRRRGLATGPAFLFVALSYVCSWPFFFEWNRANIEIFLATTCALGLLALVCRRPYLAAILFGAAGALKFYPILLLGLLIGQRRIKAALLGLASAVVVTLGSLWFVGPTVRSAAFGIAAGLRTFSDVYTNQRRSTEIGLDHSLVGLVKSFPRTLPSTAIVNHDVHLYILITGILGVILFFAYIRHLPFLNQLLCLAVACILLPPTSYDYTLLMLYLPWSLLALTLVDRHRNALPPLPGLLLLTLCFTFLLGYEPEFIHNGVRFGAQLKAVTLAILLLSSLFYRLPSVYDLQPTPTES